MARAYELGAAESFIHMQWRTKNAGERLRYLEQLGAIQYNGTLFAGEPRSIGWEQYRQNLKLHVLKLNYQALTDYAPRCKLHYDLAHVGAV